MSSQALRLDGYIIDNASILFSGCLKDLSKRYLLNNPFCRQAKHKTHCSLLIAHCSLLIAHYFQAA
ncbi:MAG: hypothetical protein II131_03275 [Neisseriaceae bacterium]|nr:hypothetical protein [Neisseriaceae bacterium]